MHQEAKDELRTRLKLTVLEYASHFGVQETCREFNIPRSSFYRWKVQYKHEGPTGLARKRPIAHIHPRKTAPEVIEKSLNCEKPIK